MAEYDVIALIAESPQAHGIYENVNTEERTVYVAVRSVGMQETYTAKSLGLAPELVFEIAGAEDYKGEKLCRYHGELYNVLRMYKKGDTVELVAGRSNQHA